MHVLLRLPLAGARRPWWARPDSGRVLLFPLALLVTLLALLPRPAWSAPAVQMLLRPGFDGVARPGTWMPLQVDLVNEGEDVAGAVEVSVDEPQSRGIFVRPSAVYRQQVELPRGAHKRLTFAVPLPVGQSSLRARLVAEGLPIVEQPVDVRRVATGELLCGVVTRRFTPFEPLNGLELSGPAWRLRVVQLAAGDLPEQAHALGGLDCLVVHDLAGARLTEAQAEALETWVRAGGLLVTMGGTGWQSLLPRLPATLVPVRVSGLAQLQSLDQLESFAGQPVEAAGPWPAARALEVRGQTVLAQDGVPLLVADRVGAGTTFFVALDPTLPPLQGWAGAGAFWRYLVSHAPPGGPGALSATAGWGNAPRRSLSSDDGLAPPWPDWLAPPLLAAALLLGPGQLLLLRRLGRTGWAAFTTPLGIGLAAAWAFGAAAAQRPPELVLNKLGVIQATAGAPGGVARSYLALAPFRPQRLTLDLGDGLASGLYYPFPRDFVADERWALRVGAGGTALPLDLAAATLTTLTVDGRWSAGQVESDLVLEGGQLSGRIANLTGRPIDDAAIVIGEQVERLGRLEPGEARSLQLDVPASLPVGPIPTQRAFDRLGPPGPREDPVASARRELLAAVFTSSIFGGTRAELAGPTLVGWIDEAPPRLEVDRPTAGRRQSLLAVQLGVRLPPAGELEVPASLMVRRPILFVAPTRQTARGYDLAAGDAIAFQFTLPTPPGRFALDRLDLVLESRLPVWGRSSGSTGEWFDPSRTGQVDVFDWRRGEWRPVAVHGPLTELTDPATLVSATGDVRVRYTFKPERDLDLQSITISRFEVRAHGRTR